MRKLRWKLLLEIGLIAGIVQALAGVVMYVAGVYFAAWSMLVSGGILVLCIVLGTRWYRDNVLGGTMTYSQALIIGIVISISTGIIYALYNVISISFLYPNFLDDTIRAGARDATLPKIAVGNLIRLSIGGAILSIITSIILRGKTLPQKS